MSEDDPARIFGETVESDAVKRKREEVQISELNLQLCEQEGALKRRRIESIKWCLEALDTSADDRDRIRATDMIREIAFGSESSTPDREVCVRQFVNDAGRSRESPGLDMKVGKLAKKLLLVDDPNYTFPRKQIYANGQLVEANMWLESQRGYIERALATL